MLQRRARELSEEAQRVLKFYGSLLGDIPYQSFTLAVVERNQPGGHSPPYFAALSHPPPATPIAWRADPAYFEGFPEFFLAHEAAHQWWGQGVGWKNYHEQWISEGFSQYFAALYAEHIKRKSVFDSIVSQMSRWTLDRSDQGPVYLGYRLGHIRNDGRVFRALVYNKGALTLHMLRRLIGDEVFFRGLRRFYSTWRFKKAGTEDVKAAFELEANRDLDRFFDRWIYGFTLPRLKFSYIDRGGRGHGPFRADWRDLRRARHRHTRVRQLVDRRHGSADRAGHDPSHPHLRRRPQRRGQPRQRRPGRVRPVRGWTRV